MNKAYTFRLDTTLITQLDMFPGSRTGNIRNAIHKYCNGNTDNNTDFIQHLESEIVYLRSQNNALLITKMPLLQRVIHRLRKEE